MSAYLAMKNLRILVGSDENLPPDPAVVFILNRRLDRRIDAARHAQAAVQTINKGVARMTKTKKTELQNLNELDWWLAALARSLQAMQRNTVAKPFDWELHLKRETEVAKSYNGLVSKSWSKLEGSHDIFAILEREIWAPIYEEGDNAFHLSSPIDRPKITERMRADSMFSDSINYATSVASTGGLAPSEMLSNQPTGSRRQSLSLLWSGTSSPRSYSDEELSGRWSSKRSPLSSFRSFVSRFRPGTSTY